MTKDTKLKELVINKLTTAQYDGIATKDPNQMYIVTDAHGFEESITNCLTYIPQDIKLELNNGTLTLKAGSKVYVPNGAGKFDVVNVVSDVVFHTGTIGEATGNITLFCNLTGGFGARANTNACVSGTTAPTDTTFIWYDTTNNMIKGYENGAWVRKYSLPIGIYYRENGKVASIKQIFNGFGHIGSTVFALPGVKGLIPNGRNADGSLKNVEASVKSVQIFSATGSGYGLTYFITSNGTLQFQNTNACSEGIKPTWFDGGRGTWFDTESNKMFTTTDSGLNWTQEYLFTFGSMYMTNVGRLDYLKTKTTFHALDYNDKSTIVGWGMPSNRYIDLTLGASGSEYTAQATGYVMFERGSTSGNKYISLYNNNSQLGVNGTTISGVANARIFLPVKKGDVFKASYSANTTNPTFRFIYAEGEK